MADEQSLDSLIGDRARDENGRFKAVTPTEEVSIEPAKAAPIEPVVPPVAAPVVTPPAAPIAQPVQAESEKEQAYKKAMQSEREKRQAAEARLRELEQPKKEPIDPWTDLPGALKQTQQDLEEKQFVKWCNYTASQARKQHADYDEMQASFLEAAQADPSLFARLRNEDNPAEFAYKHGVLHRELGSVNGDMSAYRTKIETDLRAKLDVEYAAKYGQKPTVVPTSLNGDTSPVVATEVYAGPPPLNTILRNAKSRS